ncbi:MAG: hypothetical protein LQ347_005500 [Umbilicaria vellea]|nr:MAG: hypothetical protein LQ347_005500 [Umbilicaria vellea]
MSKSTLRPIQSRDNTNDLLFRANVHLARLEPEKALPLYTKVLYETSPGHACAFLNRSLTYIALGYPELAAMDAYRAAISTDALRQCFSISADARLRDMGKYFRAEKLHIQSEVLWTTSPECHVGPGWLQSSLASIVLGMDVAPDIKDQKPLCNRLEIRALYRLAGALRECGGGAVREALDILSDVCRKYKLTPMEKRDFHELGNQMLGEVSIMLESDTSAYNSQGEAKSGYWKDMETRRTTVTREIYPWNIYEPDYRDNDVIAELQEYMDIITEPCIAEYFESYTGEAPALGLVANRDIDPKEVVLEEFSILQVATESMAWSQKYFCDGCAAALVLPNEYVDRIYSRPRGWSPLAHSFSSLPTNKNTSDGDNQSDTDAPEFSQQQQKDPGSFPSPPRAPTALRSLTPSPPQMRPGEAEFRLCSCCGEVAFCSRECEVQCSAFHSPLCTTWTEPELRETHRNKKVWTSTIDDLNGDLGHHPKMHCIHDLLFIRLVAIAIESGTHPLALNEVRYLNGGLWPRPVPPLSPAHLDPSILYNNSQTTPSLPATNRKSLPWSFESHIVRPLRYLARLGIDPHHMFQDLEKWDGWVINTLYAKIEHSVRVTRGPRRVKVYDESGDVVLLGGRGGCNFWERVRDAESTMRMGEEQDRGVYNEEEERKKDMGERRRRDDEVWIGSLHPVLSMIGFADEIRGEKANVTIEEGEKVKCVPFSATLSNHDTVGAGSENKTMEDFGVDVAEDADTDTAMQDTESVDLVPKSPLVQSGRLATATTPTEQVEAEFVPDSPLPSRRRVAIRAGERILRSRLDDADEEIERRARSDGDECMDTDMKTDNDEATDVVREGQGEERALGAEWDDHDGAMME